MLLASLDMRRLVTCRALEIVNLILPSAAVPHDPDIVPLPLGRFYIKIEPFYLAIFQCILNKIRLHLYQLTVKC